MAGRGGQLEHTFWAERLIHRPEHPRVTVESCVGGAPAAGGICLEHGESACVITLRVAG
jgi:hypothetical protein